MNKDYMDLAINEALKAKELNEVPVGALIVKDNVVISSAYNQKITKNNPCAHAEILAINEAVEKLGDWRLNGCQMYVTLTPCPMCAGAIRESRIDKVFIGTKSGFFSNDQILSLIFQNDDYLHRVSYEYMNEVKCEQILKDFFKKVRFIKNKANKE